MPADLRNALLNVVVGLASCVSGAWGVLAHDGLVELAGLFLACGGGVIIGRGLEQWRSSWLSRRDGELPMEDSI